MDVCDERSYRKVAMIEPRLKRGRAWTSRPAWIIVPALAVISALAIWSHLRYGSIGLGLAASLGSSLAVENPSQSFGNLEVSHDGFVTFKLLNSSARPITIVGAPSHCSCTSAEQLPVIIPARGRKSLRVNYWASKPGDVSETVCLLTDSPEVPQIILVVTGHVVDPAGRLADNAGPAAIEPIQ